MRILALDPGQHNGYGILRTLENRTIMVERFGVLEKEDFYEQLPDLISENGNKVDVVVVEDFKTRPNKARVGAFDWSQMVAPKVIGAIEFACHLWVVDMVLQQPAVKPPGYGFLGRDYKQGAKGVHHWDALAHGYYYLVTKKLGLPNPV